MSISIYNTLTRQKVPFEPINHQEVKMYTCGPTVYDEPHIGHARSAYVFEVIRKYLKHRGYAVKFVRNVTDVDDKIIEKAKKEFPGEDLNTAVAKVSKKYLDAYHKALESLDISAPDLEPKATEFVSKDNPAIQKFISALIERGMAYVSGQDVYFDIKKAKSYGKLSGQSLEKMEIGARVMPNEIKKDPLDFALWKAAKEGEPSWDSPWGKGRPGWHIECSVMSSALLGDEFDIHGGGLDLIFPHHENEIAQSEGTEKKFARVWMHHGLLTINGQKMAKSLGNFITVEKFIEKYKDPDLLKLLFLSASYSHPIDYTEEKIEDSRKQKESFKIFFSLADSWKQFTDYWFRRPELLALKNKIAKESSAEDNEKIDKLSLKFEQAMDDDFNTPEALGSLFKLMDLGLGFISSDKEDSFIKIRNLLKIYLNIFGINFESDKLSEEILKKLADIEVARLNKDFKKADMIRQQVADEFNFAASNTASTIAIKPIYIHNKSSS